RNRPRSVRLRRAGAATSRARATPVRAHALVHRRGGRAASVRPPPARANDSARQRRPSSAPLPRGPGALPRGRGPRAMTLAAAAPLTTRRLLWSAAIVVGASL